VNFESWDITKNKVKCLLKNITALKIYIKGLSFDDLEIGLKYQWEVVKTNMKSCFWDFGNGTTSRNKSVIFSADREEQRKICVNVSVNDWYNITRCFGVNVKKTLTLSKNPSQIVTFSNDVLVSQEDEIIRGINFGKLIHIGTQIWLSREIHVTTGSEVLLYDETPLPFGYRYFNFF